MSVIQLKDMASMGTNRYMPKFSSYKGATQAERDAAEKNKRDRLKEDRINSYAQAKADFLLKEKSKLQSEQSELDKDDEFIAMKKAEIESKIAKDGERLGRKKALYEKSAGLTNKLNSLTSQLKSYQSGPEVIQEYDSTVAQLNELKKTLPKGYTVKDIIADYESEGLAYHNALEDSKKYDNYSSKEPRAEIQSELESDKIKQSEIDAKEVLADPFSKSKKEARRLTAADYARDPKAISALNKFNKAKGEAWKLFREGSSMKDPRLSEQYSIMGEAQSEYATVTGQTLKLPKPTELMNAQSSAVDAKKKQADMEKAEIETAAAKDKVRVAITDDVSKVAKDWMSNNRKVVDGLNLGNNFSKAYNKLKDGKRTPASYAMLAKAVNKMMEPSAGVMSDDMKTVASFGGEDGGKYNQMAMLGSQLAAGLGMMGDKIAASIPGLSKSKVDNMSLPEITAALKKEGLNEMAKTYKNQWENIENTGDKLRDLHLEWETGVRNGIAARIGESQDYSNFRNTNALAQAGGGSVKDLFSTPEGQKAFSAAINSQLDNLVSTDYESNQNKPVKGSQAEAEQLMNKENAEKKAKREKKVIKKQPIKTPALPLRTTNDLNEF